MSKQKYYININGVKRRFISDINDMNLELGSRVMSVYHSRMDRDIKNKTILSLLCDCQLYELLDENLYPSENINLLIESLPIFGDDLKVYAINSFKYKGKLYSIVDFDSLTVSEYADVDSQIRNNIFDNLVGITASLYRKVNKREKKIFYSTLRCNNSKIKIKNWSGVEYNRDLSVTEYAENCEIFKDIPFIVGYYALFKILNYKSILQDRFPMIFSRSNNIYKDEFDIMQEEENKRLLETQDYVDENEEMMSFSQTWNIYHIVSMLSNDNKQEIDYWYKKNILELYTHYSYIIDKRQFEYNLNKNKNNT